MRKTYSSHVLLLRALWLAPILLFAAGLSLLGNGNTQAAISYQPSAISYRLSAISRQPIADSQQACTGQHFTDVCPGDWHYPYVTQMADMNAISGYSDGTFRPNNSITRGQIMKVVVTATGLNATVPDNPTFRDVPLNHAFYRWVEIGAAHSLISGYPCGGSGEPCPGIYFRPSANVTRGQLAKIITLALGWQELRPDNPTFADVPAANAFYGFVERVAFYGAISGYPCGASGEPCPGRYFRVVNNSTRAQACKMISLALANNPTATPTPTGTWFSPTATATFSRTPTRTVTRTNTPAPTNTPGGPCAMFPANNIWNRNIAALPTHALSNTYVNSIGATAYMHADFGSGLWDSGPIGIPYITVPGNQPRVPVSFYYDDESDPGPYPIPTNAPIEGGPDADGDRHVIVIDRDNCVLYEVYDAHPNSDGSWDAGSGARWPLTSNALRPSTWTSADAAGLPIMAGLVTYDEVMSGVIRHAIRFTAPETQNVFIWPARHQAGDNNTALPPMGLRMRLKANVNIAGYPMQVRVVMQALKDYGMILADNGAPWYISGVPDERWDNDILHQIRNLHGSDFEAVEESGLMVDPNSGQSR